MSSGFSDFKASISITNPSPLTKQMQNLLPSNYTRSQSSNSFAFLYGTGYEMENLKRTIGQSEANNYLYSPSTQNGQISVSGAGRYLIEFDVPFVVPPLNVSIATGSQTDAFIEFTDRYGMTVNVTTPGTDTISWQVSGQIGAATTEFLGDALYNNFGALFSFPRQGNAIIDDTFVSQYEKINLLVNVESMSTVLNLVNYSAASPAFNPPSPGAIRGRLRQTTVLTNPGASHELLDQSGNIIALLSFAVSQFQIADPNNAGKMKTGLVSDFLPENLASAFSADLPLPTYDVWVNGPQSTFQFNRWQQLAYQQEVFRADNVYRRLLAGINRSLKIGPTIGGLSNIFETIFAQPYIPQDIWDASDFRIFKDPKYMQYTTNADGTISVVNSKSQKDGYPAVPPLVGVYEITNNWTPEALTYNNRPIIQKIKDVPPVQVTQLNTGTKFDITKEVVRQLRVGLDLPTGGVANWNYLLNVNPTFDTNHKTQVNNGYYTNGVEFGGQTYQYNYFFLNNANDSVASIKLFYYKKTYNSDGTPHGYASNGPIVFNRDFYAVATADFYDPNTNNGKGGYWLPAELLVNYACNSNLPALANHGELVAGSNYVYKDPATTPGAIQKPQLPAIVIRLDLSNYTSPSTKFPTSTDDLILYSYADVTCTPGVVNGTFDQDSVDRTLPKYYDSRSPLTIQPNDSPFTLSPLQLAQGSFARMTSDSGMEYVTTMVGGQITFNKTVNAGSLLSPTPQNESGTLAPAGLLIMKVVLAGAATGVPYQQTGNTFAVEGTIVKNVNYNNTGRPYLQIDSPQYLLVNTDGFPCALILDSSTIDVSQYVNDPTVRTFTGIVGNMLWDTRLPVTDYANLPTSPTFQASTNFGVAALPQTPDLDLPAAQLPINQNFMVLLQGVPIGNQQTVTATWTFAVEQSNSAEVPADTGPVQVLEFADYPVPGKSDQPGILTYFSGKYFIRQYGNDPDNATYAQTYVSPIFDAYFLDYKDYLNTQYGNGVAGGKLNPQGDGQDLDTLFGNQSTPGSFATILNFFSPIWGLFSLSIIPGMEFYTGIAQNQVAITRPRNNGIALRIEGDSYAGLAFYGRSDDKIIDKPTRLLVDFTYSASQRANRHRIVEVQDDTFAGWVDGMHPDQPQDGAVFFIAGNQFKYPHQGQDQAPNGYSSNAFPVAVHASEPTAPERYSLKNATPPIFETDPSMVDRSTPSMQKIITSPAGAVGYPQRYRRPPVVNFDAAGNEHFDATYQNYTPEKIAYFKFDFDSFPVDTLVNRAILEMYFCSGFTIAEAINKNAALSYNKLWSQSRLSGNGGITTFTMRKNNAPNITVYRPANDVHWRKNFFEVLVPYAFDSTEDDNISYGIKNLFQPTDSSNLGVVQFPPSALQYLGVVNINEIAVSPLAVDPNIYVETTEGLSNIVLTGDSQIFQITGTLQCTPDGVPDISAYNSGTGKGLPIKNVTDPFVTTNSITGQPAALSIDQTTGLPSGFRYVSPISVTEVLPNMKVLVFPFGANLQYTYDANGNPTNVTIDATQEFVYGYIKSFVPPASIKFDSNSLALYKQLIDYVCPLYAQYDIKLLESDTYFPYTSFGKVSSIDDTSQNISF